MIAAESADTIFQQNKRERERERESEREIEILTPLGLQFKCCKGSMLAQKSRDASPGLGTKNSGNNNNKKYSINSN